MLENVDSMLDSWIRFLSKLLTSIKPHRIEHDVQPDWVTIDILDNIKQRDNLKKQGRFEDYKNARNEVSSCIQEAKRSVYKTKLQEGKDDPKTIWKLFKEFGANS